MYLFSIVLGITIIGLVYLWRHLKLHPQIISNGTSNSSAKTPEEYRRLAKKYLRDKRFLEAEELYAKAKALEEQTKRNKNIEEV